MPIDWKSVSEHLEAMFPGLGNRIHSKNDSERTTNDRSTQLLLINRQDTRIIPIDQDGYNIPEKRYKFHYPSTPMIKLENISDCKEDLKNCMKNITGIVNNVFDLNDQLEKITGKQGFEIKRIQDKNAYLTSQITKLHHEMEDKMDLLKKAHNLEMVEVKEKNTERLSNVLEEAKEKWQSKLKDHQQMLNDAENEIILTKARHETEVSRYETERKRLFTESYELIMKKNEEEDLASKHTNSTNWK